MLKSALFLTLLLLQSLWGANLQNIINNAPAYATIKLPKGRYYGNFIINKPLTLLGKEAGVILDANQSGTVITIKSPHVTLKNLTITHSGQAMQSLDSGILLDDVHHCKIIKCQIIDTLYGIDMKMAHYTEVRHNLIRSYTQTRPFRGDAIKIWYAHHNLIEDNTIQKSRDVTLTYAHFNTLRHNHFEENRFATHISLSHDNLIEANSYRYNSVSIMLMGAKKTSIINNEILSSNGAAGIGVVLKGAHDLQMRKNRISFNAKGIFIDTKMSEEQMQRHISYNTISYNKEAIHFHAGIQNNTLTHNTFIGNIDDIVQSTQATLTKDNLIAYNYWDHYSGFDRDGDGLGDSTHQIYQYADQLWHYNHKVKFFYGAPIMGILNFISRLAPFVEPILVIEDQKPLMQPERP